MAFVLFDGMTSLDFVGFYDAVTRLYMAKKDWDVTWNLCGMSDYVTDDRGMTVRVNRVLPDLGEYDLVFVPGGMSTRQLRFEPSFVAWLQTARPAKLKVSVCTGALLLGEAGFLQDRRATSNPSVYELLDPYCGETVRARIVQDGDVVTAGGVAASIDLGLYVVEMLTDAATAAEVQRRMDYPYYRAGAAGSDYIV